MRNYNSKFKNYLFLIFIIVFSFTIFTNVVLAKHSEEFIDFAANKIYEDCKNKDLKINKVYFDFNTPRETAHFIPWPHTLESLVSIIKEIDSEQWKELKGDFKNKNYTIYLGTGYVGNMHLECEEHWLDISGSDWYWDGILLSENNELKSEFKDLEKKVEEEGSFLVKMIPNKKLRYIVEFLGIIFLFYSVYKFFKWLVKVINKNLK